MTQEDIEWIFDQAFAARKLVTLGNNHYTAAEFKMFAEGKLILKKDVNLTDPFDLIRRGKEKLYTLMSRQLLFEEKVDNYIKGFIR